MEPPLPREEGSDSKSKSRYDRLSVGQSDLMSNPTGAQDEIFVAVRQLRFRSVGMLNCCRPSPAQSFLASVSSRSMLNIFIISGTCTSLELGLPFRLGWGRSFYVGVTLVGGAYPRCHSVQVTMHSVHPLSLHYIQVIQKLPVNAGLCSRLFLNLCNYSETEVSQLNGRRSGRRQV
jgi:hypothetical protein